MNPVTSYLCWQRKYKGFKSTIFIIKHYFFGLYAHFLCFFFLNKEKEAFFADVVILLRHKGSFDYSPIKCWIGEGFKVKVVVQPQMNDIFKHRLLAKPTKKTAFEMFVYAAYAKYFLITYRPKIVITENNGSVISSYIKAEAHAARESTKIVHIAHSIPTDNYRKFSFIDYDYYFVYGQSSIENLRSRNRLFGNCKCVISGSWLLEHRLIPKAIDGKIKKTQKSFLLLGCGPDLELLEETKYLYKLVVEYISNEPDAQLYFKPHPRSDLLLWKQLQHKVSHDNFHILNSLSSEMNHFDMAFCAFTNAILDVSKIGVTPILLTGGRHQDMFEYQRFMGRSVTNEAELTMKIREVYKDKTIYQTKTKLFSQYHLGAVVSPSKFIGQTVNSLIKGEQPEYVELP